MIWPKGVQVQLHRPTAGSIFPSSGAKIDNALPAKDLSLPVNEWNTCVITSVGDRLSVSVNQKKVGEVTGCLPQKGAIGLQSEGSEIHFRRIKIRQLPAMELSRNPTRRRAMSAVSPEKVFEPIELCPPGWAIKRWNGHAVKALSPKQEATRAKQEAQRTLRLLKRQELTWVPRVAPGVHPTVSPTFEFLRAPAFAPVP